MSIWRRAVAAVGDFLISASDPDTIADEVLLYSKEDAGVAQLFAKNGAGDVYQISPPATQGYVVGSYKLSVTQTLIYNAAASSLILIDTEVRACPGVSIVQAGVLRLEVGVWELEFACGTQVAAVNQANNRFEFTWRTDPVGTPTAISGANVGFSGCVINGGPLHPTATALVTVAAGTTDVGVRATQPSSSTSPRYTVDEDASYVRIRKVA